VFQICANNTTDHAPCQIFVHILFTIVEKYDSSISSGLDARNYNRLGCEIVESLKSLNLNPAV